MAYEDDLRRVRGAKARIGKRLLENPDVHGVGIGYRRRDGDKTDELVIVVHVQRKLAEEDVAPQRLVPSSYRYVDRTGEEVEVGVDVVERPVPVPEVGCGDCDADLEDRIRPVPGGYSGGPPTTVSNGGTLGGWVWDNVTEQAVLISNEHVFGGTAGTDISQPSPFDGGSLPADRVADVLRAGTLDVSIAAPAAADVADYRIECGGPGVYEIADATVGMVVQKTGQTTGLTCGIVELIDYDSDHYGSENDLWIDGDGNDFSMGGDSGSLYLERDHPEGSEWRRVVGIHWGGAGNDGVGHPIRAVFDDLDLTTICSGVVARVLDIMFGRRAAEEEDESVRLLPARQVPPPGPRRRHIPVRRRPVRRAPSFARAVEARLTETEQGSHLVSLIQRHRALVVRVLGTSDGRRAVSALLEPLAKSVTTDDVLSHRVSPDDLENVERLVGTVERIGGEQAAELIEFARRMADGAEDRTLHDVLASSRVAQ